MPNLLCGNNSEEVIRIFTFNLCDEVAINLKELIQSESPLLKLNKSIRKIYHFCGFCKTCIIKGSHHDFS